MNVLVSVVFAATTTTTSSLNPPPTPRVISWPDGVGTVASAVAIVVAVATGLWRLLLWLRRRDQRRHLKAFAFALDNASRALSTAVIRADAAFDVGAGWAGLDIWPAALTPALEVLDGTPRMLATQLSAVRGRLYSDAATDRIREDLERAGWLLIDAFDAYRDAVMRLYQTSGGEPVPIGATGREPIVLIDETLPAVDEWRQFRHLLRSAFLRLGERVRSDALEHHYWPTHRYHAADNPRWDEYRAEAEDARNAAGQAP